MAVHLSADFAITALTSRPRFTGRIFESGFLPKFEIHRSEGMLWPADRIHDATSG